MAGNTPAVISGPTSFIPFSRRQVATLNLVPGQVTRAKIDSILILRDIFLTLSFQVAFGTTAPVATDIQPGDEWGLINSIQLLLNSGKVRYSITGEQLVMLNWYLNNYIRNIPPALKTLPAASTTGTFTSTVVLPIKIPSFARPLDFSLNSNFLSSIELVVNTGNVGSVFATAGASIVAGSATLTVDTHEAMARNTSTTPIFNYIEIATNQTILPGSTSKFDLMLPVNRIYPRVYLNTKNPVANAAGNYVDLVSLTELAIKQGGFEPIDATPATEYYAYLYDHGINGQVFPFVNTYFNPLAWIPFDFVRDGYVTEALNVLGQQNSGFKISTNAATQVNAIMLSIQPTTVVAKA